MPILYHELQEGRKRRQGREGPEQLKLGGNRAKSTDGELTIMVITADYWVTYHLYLCQDCLQALDIYYLH